MPEWLFWYPVQGAFLSQPQSCDQKLSAHTGPHLTIGFVKPRVCITLWIMYLVASGVVSWLLSRVGNSILLSSS